MKKISIRILILFSLLSCYKKEHVETEPGEPKYKMENGPHELDRYIYEFYRKYKVFMLYEYATLDWRWDMTSYTDNLLVKQRDKEVVMSAIPYVETVVLNPYSDDFKRRYFPFKILLADSVNYKSLTREYKDLPVSGGTSYMAIGHIRRATDTVSPRTLYRRRGDVAAHIMANHLYALEMIDFPKAFFEISDNMHGVNMLELDENKGKPKEEVDIRNYGFWTADERYISGKTYMMSPDKTYDLWQFVHMITTHDVEEMTAYMKPYKKMQLKYSLLTEYFKKIGVDLQAIGNDKLE